MSDDPKLLPVIRDVEPRAPVYCVNCEYYWETHTACRAVLRPVRLVGDKKLGDAAIINRHHDCEHYSDKDPLGSRAQAARARRRGFEATQPLPKPQGPDVVLVREVDMALQSAMGRTAAVRRRLAAEVRIVKNPETAATPNGFPEDMVDEVRCACGVAVCVYPDCAVQTVPTIVLTGHQSAASALAPRWTCLHCELTNLRQRLADVETERDALRARWHELERIQDRQLTLEQLELELAEARAALKQVIAATVEMPCEETTGARSCAICDGAWWRDTAEMHKDSCPVLLAQKVLGCES